MLGEKTMSKSKPATPEVSDEVPSGRYGAKKTPIAFSAPREPAGRRRRPDIVHSSLYLPEPVYEGTTTWMRITVIKISVAEEFKSGVLSAYGFSGGGYGTATQNFGAVLFATEAEFFWYCRDESAF
jgi:hypothetical protein